MGVNFTFLREGVNIGSMVTTVGLMFGPSSILARFVMLIQNMHFDLISTLIMFY